jgi:hypothetical protein
MGSSSEDNAENSAVFSALSRENVDLNEIEEGPGTDQTSQPTQSMISQSPAVSNPWYCIISSLMLFFLFLADILLREGKGSSRRATAHLLGEWISSWGVIYQSDIEEFRIQFEGVSEPAARGKIAENRNI